MDHISMILFAVVFIVQLAISILFCIDKRRAKKRKMDMVNYIDSSFSEWDTATKEMVNEMLSVHREQLRQLNGTINQISEKISRLSIDYTEAQEAADKVNDFASSLASIFDYDPLRARHKGRDKEV